MQASNEPPAPNQFTTPHQSETRGANLHCEGVKDTPVQALKKSNVIRAGGFPPPEPDESRDVQALEMHEQLTKVSFDDFVSTLLAESKKLGSRPRNMPNCDEFLQAYDPQLRQTLATTVYTGIESNLYPVLVIQFCRS